MPSLYLYSGFSKLHRLQLKMPVSLPHLLNLPSLTPPFSLLFFDSIGSILDFSPNENIQSHNRVYFQYTVFQFCLSVSVID